MSILKKIFFQLSSLSQIFFFKQKVIIYTISFTKMLPTFTKMLKKITKMLKKNTKMLKKLQKCLKKLQF